MKRERERERHSIRFMSCKYCRNSVEVRGTANKSEPLKIREDGPPHSFGRGAPLEARPSHAPEAYPEPAIDCLR